MDVTVLSAIDTFDSVSGKVTLSIDFLTPEILDAFTENLGKQVKMKFNFTPRRGFTNALRKCWYGSLKLILLSDDVKDFNSVSLHELDEEMRLSLFPIDDNKNPPKPKRMHQLDEETGRKIIEKLHQRYSYLTVHSRPIDFSNLKGL